MSNSLIDSFWNGLSYNVLQAALVVLFSLKLLVIGSIWPPLLVLSCIATILWVALSSTNEAKEEAQSMVLSNELNPMDFMIGAGLMFILGLLCISSGLGYSIIFLIAGFQNVRYTMLCFKWAA